MRKGIDEHNDNARHADDELRQDQRQVNVRIRNLK